MTTGQIVDFKLDYPWFSRCFVKIRPSFGILNSRNDEYFLSIAIYAKYRSRAVAARVFVALR